MSGQKLDARELHTLVSSRNSEAKSNEAGFSFLYSSTVLSISFFCSNKNGDPRCADRGADHNAASAQHALKPHRCAEA